MLVVFPTVRCSTDHTKCSFYRAVNAIFAEVGRFTSDEVIRTIVDFKEMEVYALPKMYCNLLTSQLIVF